MGRWVAMVLLLSGCEMLLPLGAADRGAPDRAGDTTLRADTPLPSTEARPVDVAVRRELAQAFEHVKPLEGGVPDLPALQATAANDTCAAPLVVSFAATSTQLITVNTANAGIDYPCNGLPDVVLMLVSTQTKIAISCQGGGGDITYCYSMADPRGCPVVPAVNGSQLCDGIKPIAVLDATQPMLIAFARSSAAGPAVVKLETQ
jgi:hypothetical protein